MNAEKQFNGNLKLLTSVARLRFQITIFEEILEDYIDRTERMADALATVGCPDVEKAKCLRTLLRQMDDDLHAHDAALHAEILEAKL